MEEVSAIGFENRLLFSAMDCSRIGLCVVGQYETVVTVTPEFARHIGQAGIDLLGRNARRILADPALSIMRFAELIDVDAPEISTGGASAQLHGGSTLLFQARTITEPFTGRYRVITVFALEDLGVKRDQIVETRRQLEALRSSVVVADARQPHLPIVYVNKRFEELTGYSASEAIGRNCRFLQGPETDRQQVSILKEAIAARRSHHVILANYRKNGELFRNELFVSPLLGADGTVAHYMALQKEAGDRY